MSEETNEKQLTAKQEAFCMHYCTPNTPCYLNGSQSAIAAGYTVDCANQTAYEILTYPHVKARIKSLLELVIPSREQILTQFEREAQGLTADCFKVDAKGKLDFDWQVIIEKGLTSLISEIGETRSGGKVYKMESRQKARELLGKYHKLFADSVEISGNVNQPIKISILDDIRAQNAPDNAPNIDTAQPSTDAP